MHRDAHETTVVTTEEGLLGLDVMELIQDRYPFYCVDFINAITASTTGRHAVPASQRCAWLAHLADGHGLPVAPYAARSVCGSPASSLPQWGGQRRLVVPQGEASLRFEPGFVAGGRVHSVSTFPDV